MLDFKQKMINLLSEYNEQLFSFSFPSKLADVNHHNSQPMFSP